MLQIWLLYFLVCAYIVVKPYVLTYGLEIIYTVFQKNGHPFYFFHNSLKWWSIYTKFLSDVAEEMLIQNIWTKYGC